MSVPDRTGQVWAIALSPGVECVVLVTGPSLYSGTLYRLHQARLLDAVWTPADDDATGVCWEMIGEAWEATGCRRRVT